MDRASSLIYPGSRTLAGWWRQLAPHQPQALWVGYGFAHRVEASVKVLASRPLEPLAGLVLKALDIEQCISPGAGICGAALHERLRLPEAIIQRILGDLENAGLLTRQADGCRATELGRHAIESRQIPYRANERRVFPFMECLAAAGQRLVAPQFIPLADCAGVPWQVDADHRFDPTALQSCITQTADWKHCNAFPLDIEGLSNGVSLQDWQRVIVDRPERVMLVLMFTHKDDVQRMLAFAVKVDGWTLYDQSPVLRLPIAAHSQWPDLAQETPAALWQEAWRSWCRQRQLPSNEVESCSLAYSPPQLEVHAPARLVQRLQAAKSDLLKGEAWILVGDGYLRAAAQLVVRQAT